MPIRHALSILATLAWFLPGVAVFAQEKFSLFALVMPVIGLGLIGTTLYLFLRYRKYGVSVFEMADIPGVLGGSLGGVILTRTPVRTTDGFRLMLRNVHLWTTGAGKNRKTYRETLWEREQRLPKTLDVNDGQRAFPVLFTIPYSCHPTHKASYNKEYYWDLTLSGKAPGINYKATFRVPVFKTEYSSPTVTGELESLPDDERNSLGADVHAIPGVSVSKALSGGEELAFSSTAGGKVGAAITLLISAGLLGAAFVVGLGGLSVFMGLVLAAIGGYAGWCALGSLFGSTLIGVQPDRLEITRKFLGLTTSSRIILGKELRNIQVISPRASNENNHYTLRLDLDADERIRLPLRISGQINAEILAEHIRKLAGV